MWIGGVWIADCWAGGAWGAETWAMAAPPTGWDDSWEFGAWAPGSWVGYWLGTATLSVSLADTATMSTAAYESAEMDDEPL